ncbi:MAG: hypothetical protein H7Y20_07755 [Bryobacteraceae bacterium]|nr:hypothetical protein [Bryobacteraceae bacterium]
MKRTLWILLAAVAVLSLILFLRSPAGPKLDVDPKAAREIEKARGR